MAFLVSFSFFGQYNVFDRERVSSLSHRKWGCNLHVTRVRAREYQTPKTKLSFLLVKKDQRLSSSPMYFLIFSSIFITEVSFLYFYSNMFFYFFL